VAASACASAAVTARQLLLQLHRRALDRLADAEVAAAAADVLDLVDVRVGRSERAAQQRDGRHDLTWLAVAALRDVLLQPGLLHGVQPLAVGKALDRRDLAPSHVADVRDARVEGGAVQVAGARLADVDAAPVLRPRETELVAQRPQHRQVAG
jgi:hypothetical protein